MEAPPQQPTAEWFSCCGLFYSASCWSRPSCFPALAAHRVTRPRPPPMLIRMVGRPAAVLVVPPAADDISPSPTS